MTRICCAASAEYDAILPNNSITRHHLAPVGPSPWVTQVYQPTLRLHKLLEFKERVFLTAQSFSNDCSFCIVRLLVYAVGLQPKGSLGSCCCSCSSLFRVYLDHQSEEVFFSSVVSSTFSLIMKNVPFIKLNVYFFSL